MAESRAAQSPARSDFNISGKTANELADVSASLGSQIVQWIFSRSTFECWGSAHHQTLQGSEDKVRPHLARVQGSLPSPSPLSKGNPSQMPLSPRIDTAVPDFPSQHLESALRHGWHSWGDWGGSGAALEDLCGSLPAENILWFCDSRMNSAQKLIIHAGKEKCSTTVTDPGIPKPYKTNSEAT